MNRLVSSEYSENLFQNEEGELFLLFKYFAIYNIDDGKIIEIIFFSHYDAVELTRILSLETHGPLGDGTFHSRTLPNRLSYLLNEERYLHRSYYTSQWLRHKADKLGHEILDVDIGIKFADK